MSDFATPLVVVSDVHLRGADDERALALESLVDRMLEGRVGTFVLNGDIFDFCFGWRRYFRDKYHRLGKRLKALSESGTQVIFVEGNHEFAFRKMGWDWVRVESGIDVQVEVGAGETVRITHGDLLHCDFWYRIFRWLVKSWPAIVLARLLSPRWFDAWGLEYATHSRGNDQYRELDEKSVVDAAMAFVDRKGDQHLIFGHFHVPFLVPLSGDRGHLCSVESWDHPNALLFKEGRWWRAYLEQGQWRITPAPLRLPSVSREIDRAGAGLL